MAGGDEISGDSKAADTKAKRITDLRIQRGVIIGQQTRMKNQLDGEPRLNAFEAESKLGLLESHLKGFEAVQRQLEVLDADEPQSGKRDTFEDTYCQLKAKLLSIIDEQRPRQSVDISTMFNSTPSSDPLPTKLHLQKIYLSKFSGSYDEWMGFIGMFNKLIDSNQQLSPLEKFQHLRSSLTGVAASVIEGIELTTENYSKAKELLEKRFDNRPYIFASHIGAIFQLQSIRNPSTKNLRHIADTINKHMRCLLSLGSKENIADGFLLHILVTKLDFESQMKWQEATMTLRKSETSNAHPFPTWEEFSEFLEQRCSTIEFVEENQNQAASSKTKKSTSLIANGTLKTAKCSFCEAAHTVFDCPTLRGKTPSQIYERAKQLKLCFNCLRKGHSLRSCMSSKCRMCKRSHHTLLHGDIISNQSQSAGIGSSFETTRSVISSASSLPTGQTNPQQTVSMSSRLENSDVILATAVIRVTSPLGISIECRAILDSGSQINFMTERLAQQLRLKHETTNISISGICMTSAKCLQRSYARVNSVQNEFSTSLEFFVVPRFTGMQPAKKINFDRSLIPNNVRLADPDFDTPNRVDVLLGAEIFYKLLCVGQVNLGENQPTIQKTLLGWIISGPSASAAGLTVLSANFKVNNCPEPDENGLDSIVAKFWEMENCESEKEPKTVQERLCEEHFHSHSYREANGRFVVRLPFKEDPSVLGGTYDVALKRLYSLERKLANLPKLRDNYNKFMEEYISLGHMAEIHHVENIFSENHFFFPHHAVMKEDSTSTKLRVVFDGSCKSSSGVSLNDVLMVGPTLQDDLFVILLRFRFYRYVLSADIAKMYRQVLIHPDDRRFQLVLFRFAISEPVKAYKLNTVTYGNSAASFLAIKALRQLAEDGRQTFPVGASVVLRDFFVDNMLTGANTINEALAIKEEVTKILQGGGFDLKKWCSNETELLRGINKDDREAFTRLGDTDVIKTLGLAWDPTDDKLMFTNRPLEGVKLITKRTILSETARFFDPLGLLSPIVVTAKLVLQELWTLKLHWDESVPIDLQTRWLRFREELKQVNNFTFPRHVTRQKAKVQLHGFSDASQRAYGACIYIRSETDDGTIQSKLLCSKSRIAPLRTVTIPRLELCSAQLLADLVKRAQAVLNVDFSEIFCWTDSQVVLSWLNAPSYQWSTFVANRVSKIQQCRDHNWRYIPTSVNPADLISRGASPAKLCSSSLWFYGPKFLVLNETDWPRNSRSLKNSSDIPERRKPKYSVLLSHRAQDLVTNTKYINSYSKTVRVFAYVNRFIERTSARRNSFRSSTVLTVQELESGLVTIIRSLQRVYFAKDYIDLKNGALHSKSRILSLNPFLDNDEVMRVGGRIKHSDIPFDAKHQMLLPRSHPFTSSILKFLHESNCHAGCQTLISIFRQRFWLINVRSEARRVIHRCIPCFRAKPIALQQIMGNLPSSRVNVAYPFAITGVDFCGPFHIRSNIRGRAPSKAYLSIFICFVTKAVHFELVLDLSTPAFIRCLKRFISRRGKCSKIYSDNATNFVGCKNKLKELRELFLSEEHVITVQQTCLQEGIEWSFVPPGSPHFGGLWEAAVKKAKFHLTRVVGNSLLHYDELSTVLCQAEAVINSRPITPLSEDPNDFEALTPAHFLIGRPLTALPEPNVTNLNCNRLDKLQKIAFHQQVFWERWRKEYLNLLQERGKWTMPTANARIGQLILMKEDGVPSLKWALGRIVAISPGNDQRIRVATVKTPTGIFTRAITKLCPLPIDEEDENYGFHGGEDVEE